MLVATSLGGLLASLLFEVAKNIGGRTASEFILKKIKSKFKQKYHKDPDEESISDENLAIIRKLLHEELEAYGITAKQVDMLLMKAVKQLSEDHAKILKKLDIVEGLLVKLSATLLYEAHMEGTEVPDGLSEKLFERFIAGDKAAEKKIEEYIKQGDYAFSFREKLKKYEPIRKAYKQEDVIVSRFLKQFAESEDKSVGELALFAELWAFIGSPTLDTNLILEKITLQLLDSATIEETDPTHILKFLHLLDMTDALGKLSFQAQSFLISFLTSAIQQAEYYKQIEMAYFLMKMDAVFPELFEIVEKAMSELSKQRFSDKFVKESVAIDKKILGFFRKQSKVDVSLSLRALKSLVKRFQRRQFKRSTALLHGQLTRTLAETNLLAANIDTIELDEDSLEGLKQTLLDLVDVLIKAPDSEKLSEEVRILIWKNIDNCLFIINRLAIQNTKSALKDFEIDLAKFHGIYSSDLGVYERKSAREIKTVLRKLKISQALIKKAEEEKKKEIIRDFPEPPAEAEEKERGILE